MVTHTSIILRMVTHHPKDCHPTSKRVVIPSMVIHHPELRKSDKALRNSNKTWSLTLAQPSILCLQTWGQSKQSCQRYYENYQTFPFIQISQAEGTQTSKIERSSTNKNMRGSWSWRILQKYWKYHNWWCITIIKHVSMLTILQRNADVFCPCVTYDQPQNMKETTNQVLAHFSRCRIWIASICP